MFLYTAENRCELMK